jgi:hypothetical protein
LQREDYLDFFEEKFKELNIPVIKYADFDRIDSLICDISDHKYKQIDKNSLIFLSFIDN